MRSINTGLRIPITIIMNSPFTIKHTKGEPVQLCTGSFNDMVVEVLIKWQRRYRFEGTYRNEGHTKGTKILGSVPFLYIQEKK